MVQIFKNFLSSQGTMKNVKNIILKNWKSFFWRQKLLHKNFAFGFLKYETFVIFHHWIAKFSESANFLSSRKTIINSLELELTFVLKFRRTCFRIQNFYLRAGRIFAQFLTAGRIFLHFVGFFAAFCKHQIVHASSEP